MKIVRHSIESDKDCCPALREQLAAIRGTVTQTAEQVTLPKRFAVEHTEKATVIIWDTFSEKGTEVPLFAYKEVRQALRNLFS